MTMVVPAEVRVDGVRAAPLQCLIAITVRAVFVSAGGDDIMTALHAQGSLYGVEWHLPPGVHLASSARSALIGDVQAAVLRAAL